MRTATTTTTTEGNRITAMPVSFGVVLLGLGFVLCISLGASALGYFSAALRWDNQVRATEQRLGHRIAQLQAAADAAQARQQSAEQRLAEQTRIVEQLSAEVEAARGRATPEPRATRAKRVGDPWWRH
jgi:biopolymer transport protein ExbB/TolQ